MKDYLMRVAVYSFLTLTLCTADDTAVVVGQSEPVVATVGDDVILPCTLRITVGTVNAVDEAVVWQRPDLHPKEVHFYRSLGDYNDDQNPSYTGRTSLFKEEIKNGNVSLKLTRVKLSDDGLYICFIPTLKSLNQKASVQLSVGAASEPQVSIVGVDLMGVVLKCEAGGLMYIPEMTWLDSDGTILPDGSTKTETETDLEGRYTVRGLVTIQKTDNNTITCRVLQQKINHKMETQIHVPDRMFPFAWFYWKHSYWWLWLIGGGALVFVRPYLCGFIQKYKDKRNRGMSDLEGTPVEVFQGVKMEADTETTGS